MLSIASAALSADKNLLGTFSANLETLPGVQPANIGPEVALSTHSGQRCRGCVIGSSRFYSRRFEPAA